MSSKSASFSAPPLVVASQNPNVTNMQPALLGVGEFQRFLGGIGRTSAYAIIKEHEVQTIKLLTRTMVPLAEAQRVVREIEAAQRAVPPKDTTAATAASVASRRAKAKPQATPVADIKAEVMARRADRKRTAA